jgi:hypothetical protein
VLECCKITPPFFLAQVDAALESILPKEKNIFGFQKNSQAWFGHQVSKSEVR